MSAVGERHKLERNIFPRSNICARFIWRRQLFLSIRLLFFSSVSALNRVYVEDVNARYISRLLTAQCMTHCQLLIRPIAGCCHDMREIAERRNKR